MIEKRIRLLAETTINQIAAGEVIENAASVVKELVENALDANSTEIHIETAVGGRQLVRVVDNGCGMSPDDLLLSIERHATSKLTVIEDFNQLQTLGFRGEALPSIASVSRLSLHSCDRVHEGVLLRIEGGKIGSLVPTPRQRGTTVEVRGLFYNVPVRRKFQKSVGHETGEIHKVLARCALSHPDVSFTWIHDGVEQFSFAHESTDDARIKLLLGEEFFQDAFFVEHKTGGFSLQGRISSPAFHRPTRAGQYLFINQRSVVSSWFAAQVLNGYGTRLSSNRFPLFILRLSIPPTWVDVNVHPQKREVRFQDEERLAKLIGEALEKAFEKRVSERVFISQPLFSFPEPAAFCVAEEKSAYHVDIQEKTLFSLPARTVIAHVGNILFVQEAEGIRIVDGNRAYERLLFDELSEKKEKKAIQSLLLPIQITQPLLERHVEELNAWGLHIREFGRNTWMIDAIPALLEPLEISDLIAAYLEEEKIPVKLEKVLKRRISSLEAGEALVEKLFRSRECDYTPSGKKIHLLLDETRLEKCLDKFH